MSRWLSPLRGLLVCAPPWGLRLRPWLQWMQARWRVAGGSDRQRVEVRVTILQREVARTNIFCKGSVDTTIPGVDTMVQNKGRNVKKSPSQVDTSPEQVDTTSSQVDTRDLFQGTVLLVWDSVSTHLKGR
ncbi:hypothetical protein Taro_000377 [Colocasia esculenta]|uniref:Uncharacterized protein n=1 Tax=Colocasia esculenta TaxID=4460 RepID=A0A843T6Z1_COLES|nr:hypothetical protein [Colocasia esculenta]